MDAQERKDDNDQQKYEILFTKDQEMTQFIDSFQQLMSDEQSKMTEKQTSITQTLENITKCFAITQNVAPEGHLRDMEDELDFKNKQLANSETTQNRLEGELAKRQGELDKIESLDTKITLELQQVEAKMKQYEEEMATKFDRLADVQSEGGDKQKGAEERKQQLDVRLSALRQQVGFLKLKGDSRRQQLQDDEVAQGVDAQENKIRQFGQTLHALSSFIRQKSQETDFSGEMATCLDRANQLNKILLEPRLSQNP